MPRTSSAQPRQTRTPLARRTPLRRKRPTPRIHKCVGCSARISTSVCPTCKTRRATKRTSIKARCDRMAAQIVKLRANGKCEHCGRLGPLDWAHGWPRRHHSLRWETGAAFGLCRDSHAFFTNHPTAWTNWLIGRLGQFQVEAYERRANEPWDRDYGRVLAELTAALKQAKGEKAS